MLPVSILAVGLGDCFRPLSVLCWSSRGVVFGVSLDVFGSFYMFSMRYLNLAPQARPISTVNAGNVDDVLRYVFFSCCALARNIYEGFGLCFDHVSASC